jgi:hypothetical protein
MNDRVARLAGCELDPEVGPQTASCGRCYIHTRHVARRYHVGEEQATFLPIVRADAARGSVMCPPARGIQARAGSDGIGPNVVVIFAHQHRLIGRRWRYVKSALPIGNMLAPAWPLTRQIDRSTVKFYNLTVGNCHPELGMQCSVVAGIQSAANSEHLSAR